MSGDSRRNFSRESKYYAMHEFLSMKRGERLNLTFSELESVLGFQLPRGARANKSWWGNGRSGHSQARAWLLAGWRVSDVDVLQERVEFVPDHRR
jgi:hypothetical protein